MKAVGSPSKPRRGYGKSGFLISKGTPIAYVQQALGHASIVMTVDTYGSWLLVEASGRQRRPGRGYR
jgi:integrase